ncbi:hypothetical protein Scep_029781 [Stephania cephalantha]|uniref:Uncharacterized protein n=1 Tax=Stephania cephalantha TaxID=152367 RepID=A0AAP0HHZ9_9MAGN
MTLLAWVRAIRGAAGGGEESRRIGEDVGDGADAHPEANRIAAERMKCCWFLTWLQMQMWRHGIGGAGCDDAVDEWCA